MLYKSSIPPCSSSTWGMGGICLASLPHTIACGTEMCGVLSSGYNVS